MTNFISNKEAQAITGGIFYCRDSGYFSVSASNKLSCIMIGQCFEIGNKNIPPNRYMQQYEDIKKAIPFRTALNVFTTE
jgi:hypothetical protein